MSEASVLDRPSPAASLHQMLAGATIAQFVAVVARLGVPDCLAAGPRTSDDLARDVGADPDRLHRVLRALATFGVFDLHADGRFGLTPLGELLRSDAPGSLRGVALWMSDASTLQALASAEHAVRTGECAFHHAHGVSMFEFFATHPDVGKAFDARSTAGAARAIDAALRAFDFGTYRTIVDVGGSRGGLLARVLATHTSARGILFDLRHAIDGAADVLGPAGVLDRCERVVGNFFESVPTGGDLYVLKSILHDWTDEECVRIVANCARAMPHGASLIAIERAMPEGRPPPDVALADVHMLLYTNGRERTSAEYQRLFERGGLVPARVLATDGGVDVLEARKH